MPNTIAARCYRYLAMAFCRLIRTMRSYHQIRRWRNRLLREHRKRTRQ